MKIVEEEVKKFRLVYEDVHGNGYAFPCDEMGNILWGKISCPTAVKMNLAKAKENSERWRKNGEVVTLISRIRYGICPGCGRRVYLNGECYFEAFECECGKWYNRFGQELKNPKSWDWGDNSDEY